MKHLLHNLDFVKSHLLFALRVGSARSGLKEFTVCFLGCLAILVFGIVNIVARNSHSVFRRGQVVVFAELFRVDSVHCFLFEEVLVRSQSILEFSHWVFFISEIVSLLIESQNHVAVNIKCFPFNVLEVSTGSISAFFPVI